MADEWQEVLLEELAAPTRNALVGGPFGSDLVSADYSKDGVPVIRGQNLADRRWVGGEFVFVPEAKADKLSANTAGPLDIVFTQRGANHYRQVAVVPDNADRRFVISQSQMKLTIDRSKADSLFVYYAFRSPEQQDYMRRHAIQTGVPHTNLSILRRVPLCVPSLHTQRSIAHILGTLDDKIELNRRMSETLEAMARALFKSWFVDFDPVRAKMEGRDPGLPKHFADLFPDRLVDSELGEIPEGWEIGQLENFVELAYGRSLPSKQRRPGPIAVYGSGGITGTHDTPLVEGPAVIVGRKGTVGSLYWEDGPVFPIDTVFYVIPRVGSLLFNYHLLETQPLREMNTDAAVPGLNRSNAYRLEVPRPDNQLIAAFDDAVGMLWRRRAVSQNESRILIQTRDFLLPRLMSGETRLSDAKKAVEAVA